MRIGRSLHKACRRSRRWKTVRPMSFNRCSAKVLVHCRRGKRHRRCISPKSTRWTAFSSPPTSPTRPLPRTSWRAQTRCCLAAANRSQCSNMPATRQASPTARSMPLTLEALGKSTKRSATARAEKPYFPNIDEAVLANCISTYQQLGCWTPHVEITEVAYQATLDIFEYNGLITERFAYDQACAKPQWGDRNSGNADLTPSAAHSTDHSHSTRSGRSPRTSKYWRARLPGPRRSGPFGLSRSGPAPSRYPASHPVPTQT